MNTIYAGIIGLTIGILFSFIIYAFFIRERLDKFHLDQTEFNLKILKQLQAFSEHESALMKVAERIADSCKNQLQTNMDYGAQVMNLVKAAHESEEKIVQNCCDVVEAIKSYENDRSKIEDDRWSLIYEYIKSSKED